MNRVLTQVRKTLQAEATSRQPFSWSGGGPPSVWWEGFWPHMKWMKDTIPNELDRLSKGTGNSRHEDMKMLKQLLALVKKLEDSNEH